MAEYTLQTAHLYGDLMNTYGDYGNIVALNFYAKQLGVAVETDMVLHGEDFDDTKYDFVFLVVVKTMSKWW